MTIIIFFLGKVLFYLHSDDQMQQCHLAVGGFSAESLFKAFYMLHFGGNSYITYTHGCRNGFVKKNEIFRFFRLKNKLYYNANLKKVLKINKF